MSTALEVRAPFLDQVLVEYALSLPATSRRGLWRTKPLLRRAARTLLPSAIVRRPKHGFGVLVGAWLRGDLRELATDLLDSDRLQRQGIFDPACVSSLLPRHLDGVANHAKELWALPVHVSALGDDLPGDMTRRLLLLLILIAPLYVWRLDRPGFSDTEGMFAEPAREMVVSGDWVTPRMNGEPFLTKPPLMYWLPATVFTGSVAKLLVTLCYL